MVLVVEAAVAPLAPLLRLRLFDAGAKAHPALANEPPPTSTGRQANDRHDPAHLRRAAVDGGTLLQATRYTLQSYKATKLHAASKS